MPFLSKCDAAWICGQYWLFFSFTIWCHTYCNALYCAYLLLDRMITGSVCLPNICSHDACAHRVPPLAAHLTPETSEPREGQMVDAGWGLVCMCAFLCTSQCENKRHQGHVEIAVHSVLRTGFLFILCVLFHFVPDLGLCFPSPCLAISCFLPCCCSGVHVFLGPHRCYQQPKAPPVSHHVRPLSEQVANRGTRAQALSVRSQG